jgi:hypothetical protein
MAILRMFGDLPPDFEVELYRETSGEQVNWSGRSSGVIEKLQGWAVVGAGAIFALVNIGGPAAALGVLVDLIERGRTADIGAHAATAGGLLLFAGGVAIAAIGWRLVQSSERVVWAITNKRLIRLVIGPTPQTRSWTKSEIVKVERINWTDPATQALTVTVRARRNDTATFIIVGPADLEAAEAAFAAMED